jgi:4a-hydroxytetrahydrobiopterin dehydratase
MKLIEQRCIPIETGTEPLSREEAAPLFLQVPGWSMDERELRREFKFKDFRTAMEFVNAIAKIVDAQNHHPDITISYNKVTLVLTTHKINGLSINDFIIAAKIDGIAERGMSGIAA